MRNDLITITPKLSKFVHIWFIILICIILTVLHLANVILLYKLSLIIALIIASAILIYQYLSSRIKKYDLLLELNNAIIWRDNKTELMEIEKLSYVGSWLIIIQLKNNESKQTLFLFFDSIETIIFKNLMRHIRWQKPKLN